MGADGEEESVERQGPDTGPAGVDDGRLLGRQVAVAPEPFVPCDQGVEAGAAVVGGGGDLKSERPGRVVED